MPLGSWSESSLLVWPMRQCLRSASVRSFEPFVKVSEPKTFAITKSMARYVACPIVFRSWGWQLKNRPTGALPKPAVRIFARAVGDSDLFDMACHAAFWNLSTSSILSLANFAGEVVDSAWSSFDLMFHLVKRRLKLSDDQTLEILAKRLHFNHLRDSFVSTLMEIDEAIDCFDKDDFQKVKEEQKVAQAHVRDREALARDFMSKREEVRGGKAPKGKAKVKATKWPSTVSQEWAKTLIPEGSWIWRGLAHRSWNGHHPPAPRCSASWDECALGEMGSMRVVVSKLWQTHLDHWGLPKEYAPSFVFGPWPEDLVDDDA